MDSFAQYAFQVRTFVLSPVFWRTSMSTYSRQFIASSNSLVRHAGENETKVCSLKISVQHFLSQPKEQLSLATIILCYTTGVNY